MAITLGNISQDDIQRADSVRNHPDYEDGFGDDGDDLFGGDSMDDSMGDLNSLFGDSSSGGFGSDSSGFGSSGATTGGFGDTSGGFGSTGSFGSTGGFGSTNNGFGTGGFGSTGGGFGGGGFGNTGGFGSSPFGAPQNQNQQQQNKEPDLTDKLIESGIDVGKSVGKITMEMVKSVRERNADDLGYLGRTYMITGAALAIVSLFLGIIGTTTGIKFLSFSGMSIDLLFSGLLILPTGLCIMGASALYLVKLGDKEELPIESIPDIPEDNSNFTDTYSDNADSMYEDLFGDDFDLDSALEETDMDYEQEENDDPFESQEELEPIEIDYDKALEEVNENQYISRELLFNTFKVMFPTCTPNFSDQKEISDDTDEFRAIQAICLKALANLINCDMSEVDSEVESIIESFFSYEIKLKRLPKVKKTDDLAREIEAYMREDSSDDGVNATVSIVGDFYKITVTKGVSAIVTFGDIFRKDYCCDFFLNTKNKLPMVVGIDELGNVLLDDAKIFDTMMIIGKPRSGKSWYVLSILMSLILFNTPEDVQFCIIDPKESNLFKTMALLPHVFGLHNDKNILDILDDIIEVEAPRRKKLLADHRCDDIWALRKKGVQIPVLYVMIDEYITVVNNLDKDEQKELNAKIQTLISQLPSQGIRLIFIPHRATGIVDKTNRTMIQYTGAVRSDNEEVKDALGIQKWDRALTKPGDIAVKTSSMRSALAVRGAALTTDDGENTQFIETAAKAFYKMGVDIPDMTNLRVACNRDEEYIKNELSGGGKTVQYDTLNLDNISDSDLISLMKD